MRKLSAWAGSGLLTAAMSAAVLVGAGVAVAQTDPGPDPTSGSASAPSPNPSPDVKPDESKPDESKPDESKPDAAEQRETERDVEPAEDVEATAEPDSEPAEPAEPDTPEVAAAPRAHGGPATLRAAADQPAVSGQVDESGRGGDLTAPIEHADITSAPATTPAVASATVEPAPQERVAADAEGVALAGSAAEPDESGTVTALRMVSAATITHEAVDPPQTTILGFITSVLFGLLTSLEQFITGPPRLPAGSTVTVRSSSLQITDTMTVAADWYFPEGEDPPQRMILLQHGFLAIGPMYSYTAAQLAEDTHSIVVTPTLTSNPFADGGLWLGGDGMHEAIAALFASDRTALTASALAAGYAEKYGLDPSGALLPEEFALAGHSLGGALVSGASKYLVINGGVDDLVGVISLDGVPLGSQMPDALAALADYERAAGRFVPVRVIGAPWNYLNAFSNVNESLTAARPNHYNGVILSGGVHMDPMQGGNALIQFAAFVIAGFPQPQNPPAVHQLMVSWLDAWFTDTDDDRAPGPTFVIETPEGPATAVVIGAPPTPAVTTRESVVTAA